MAELATAYVSIVASAKGITKSIQSELGGPLEDAGDKAGGKTAKRFGASFKSGAAKAAKVAAVGFGAAFVGAVALGKASVNAASDLDESMTKVGEVFGDASGSVIDWSRDSAKAFGQSQQSALEAAGTYGNLFQAFGVGQKPAQEMSQSLVELAADLASFNNTSVDDALTALQSGLSGETEPLKKYGVAINDARLKQKAFELGLISSTKDALDPAAKAQAAYALVMQDTTLAQGDFGRTSDGLANQQRILGARWKDLQATLGRKLIPVIAKVFGFVADKLIPAFQDFAEKWMPKIIGAVKGVVDVLSSMVDGFKEVFSFIVSNKPLLFGLATLIGTVVVGALVAWAAATWAQVAAYVALNAAQILAMAKFVAIAAAIAAVVAAVVYAYQNWEWFRTVVDGVRAWMVDTLWPAIKSVFGWLRDNVPGILQAVGRFFTDVLWPPVKTVFGWIRDNIPPILQAVASFFTDVVLPAITSVWSFIQDTLWPIFRSFGEFLVNVYVGYVQAVVDIITTLWGWLQTLWDRSEGLRAFLAGAFKLGVDTAKGAFDTFRGAIETVWDWVQKIWDRAEPFRAFLAGAFWLAVTIVGTAFDAISTAVSAVWSWFQAAWDKAKEVGGYLKDGFKSAIDIAKGAWDGVVGVVQTVWNWLDKIVGKATAAIEALQGVKALLGGTINSRKVAPGVGQVNADPDGKAGGGPVMSGRPYVVGERGWEYFVPNVDGYIVPHDESVALASGRRGGVTIEQANFYDATDIDGFARAINLQLA